MLARLSPQVTPAVAVVGAAAAGFGAAVGFVAAVDYMFNMFNGHGKR